MVTLGHVVLVVLLALATALMFTIGTALADDASYSPEESGAATRQLCGGAAQGTAGVPEKVFEEPGRPNAYITGEEESGAAGIGAT